MKKMITSAKHFSIILLTLAFFLPTAALADNTVDFDDDPEPGCETVVSLNDFL